MQDQPDTVFIGRQRETVRSRNRQRGLSIFIFELVLACVSTSQAPAQLARFEVTNVRTMTPAEYAKRLSSDPATKYIIHFRLEVSAVEGLYVLLSGPKGAAPLGYTLQRSGNGSVWIDAWNGQTQTQAKNPGFEKLAKRAGARWVFFPTASAYEWEVEAEATPAAAENSRSVFVRKDMNGEARELTTTWFKVGGGEDESQNH